MKDKGLFLRHCRLIPIETIDHNGLGLGGVHPRPDTMGELAWRQLGGINLLNVKRAGASHGFEIETHGSGSIKEKSEFLVEYEERGLFSAPDGSRNELKHECALARARGSDQQRTGPLLDSAA
jgi:hypothetical protein